MGFSVVSSSVRASSLAKSRALSGVCHATGSRVVQSTNELVVIRSAQGGEETWVWGMVVEVAPGWDVHKNIYLGAEAPDGFRAEVYDPSLWPGGDVEALYLDKTIAVFGTIEVNAWEGNMQIICLDPEQIMVIE